MKFNLPVIILKDTVLMPEAEIKLEYNDDISKNVLDESELFHNNNILILSKLGIEESCSIDELPKIGTIAHIEKKIELPNGNIRVFLKGINRAKIIEFLNFNENSIETIVTYLNYPSISKSTNKAIIRKLNLELENYINKVPYMSNSLLSLISDSENLEKITDIIVNYLPVKLERKLKYLLEINPTRRAEMILEDMYKEQQLFSIEQNIDTKVRKELDNDEKNFYLKQKIKELQSEIGESYNKDEELKNLRDKLANLRVSNNVRNKILNEINRYDEMSSMSPEIGMVKNYIDYMLSLPWDTFTDDEADFSVIKDRLNKSHFDLVNVKSRIIEYLAVKKVSNDINSPIICLVGPPGVGKTTLAKSIADSMGRNFTKISLGGCDDEAIIKGHTRAYLGAIPGRIIDGMRRAKSCNPVFLIDEIDKMSNRYKGDPTSALLEVLDSNQNKYFKDNYIEEEYDLSNVLFIATANNIDNISNELKDRLEIINIDGYTELDKVSIARKHLIPKICSSHGIKNIRISDDKLIEIIRSYTKESGVRELERLISKIVRKIVTEKVVNNKKMAITINNIEKYLGKKIYGLEKVDNLIGTVNSLVYTNYGGDVTSIECSHYKGEGNIIVTGSLGDVMLESARIALSYIKANYKLFNIDYKQFNNDIHINVPNISIKKDGPSAGVSIVTAIISDLTNLKINSNIAFTGEITLRGNILKVSGLKEKIIGAYINNVDTVFIPYSNINDLDEIPEEIKVKINFIPVKNYIEIYKKLIG